MRKSTYCLLQQQQQQPKHQLQKKLKKKKAHLEQQKKVNIASLQRKMASSLLDLGDLIAFQLERLKLDELNYKDELQLQRYLLDLDLLQCPQRRHKSVATTHRLANQQHQALQVPEASTTDLTASPTGTELNPACSGALARSSSRKSKVSQSSSTAGAPSAAKMLGNVEIAMEELGAAGGSMTLTNSFTDSEDDALGIDQQKEFRSLVLEWFQQLRSRTEDFKSDEESRRMREAGNDSYRKERHALKACDLYTEAIFLAPSQDSIAAAMAHANRSTVLHDCGMYEQSYDDCLCALDLGYPEEYHPLIKLRQASCALKLRNFALCEQHLHELLHMELSETFEARTHELWHECEVLKAEKIEMGVQTDNDLISNDIKIYEVAWLDNSNVMTTTKSAFLRATTNIPNNTPIFHEEAAVFVPSGAARLCDHCGITQFVPFPCIFCSNRTAVYCSRKCRAAHASIHALECYAHQIELFEEFGVEFSKPRLLQLAFRMLINGLPQVVPHCRKKPTVGKMWNAFNSILTERTCTSSSASLAASATSYSALLRLESHLDKEEKRSMVSFAIVAHILAIYLGEYTDFFELLELTMPAAAKLTRQEWELLASALLLRHICQLRHKNLIHCPSFVLPADPHVLSPNDEFMLWETVRHVRRGYLHLIAGDVTTVAYAVFPQTLSHCRHSCADMIYRKINGCKLTAYSTTDIQTDTCICNCFISGNYKQSLYERRKQELTIRGIDCKCEKCFRPYPDEDFHKFHRYRCDNPNCKQIFTPSNLKRSRNLRWWKSDYYRRPENNGSELLICDVCEHTQKFEWFWTFSAALTDCDSIEERCKLYAAIERADTQLIDTHECKVALARQLVEQCLLIHREGSKSLDEWELNKLGSIMRSALHIVAAQFRIFSIEYVQHMSYFWDVMALSNYKCGDKELMQMLHALEYIPDEYKEIFINYYEDFIAPKFMEETYGNILDTEV
ncbi:down and out isoform 1-T2 [Glossina fuscipes fuscipes]